MSTSMHVDVDGAVAAKAVAAAPSSLHKVVTSSFIGTVLEWYDFYIYGTAATLVFGELFFPTLDPTSATLAAFAAYGIGFVLKPVGGVILSRYGDTMGRKKVLLVSLVMMGLATGTIGLLPTYNQIGGWAPALLVLLRLVQSIGAGAEYGGALTMVSEFSTAKNRGLLTSLPALGVSLGILIGTAMFAVLSMLPKESLMQWGWRLPFLAGFSLVLVGLYMRLQVRETPVFQQLEREKRLVRSPFLHLIKHEWRRLLIAAGARSADAVGSQFFNVFAIAYCIKTLGLPPSVGLMGVMLANLVGLAVIPIVGFLCDRFGRRPVYLAGLAFLIAFIFPYFWLLETRQPVLIFTAMILAYGVGVKVALSASGAFLAELFGAPNRSTGVTLARTISDPIAGATPLIASALVAASSDYRLAAAFALGVMVLAFLCVVAAPETQGIAMIDTSDVAADRTS